MSTKKRKAISLDAKYEILQEIEKGQKSKSQIACDYGLASSTLSTILKNKDCILENFNLNKFEPKRKRFRSGNYSDIEDALCKWFTSVRSNDIALSGPFLASKAEKLAKDLGYHEFVATNGFIERFKQRRGINCQSVCGESKSVDQTIIDDWKTEKLPLMTRDYAPCDIYNVDETGLFYKLQPSKTLHFKDKACDGGKLSKERIIVLLGSNMDGTDKLVPLVIGKFGKPRCFKYVKSLPVTYRSNKNSWMSRIGMISRQANDQEKQKNSSCRG